MNLNQFEYLLAIYQEKSITKAAANLFVSAPAVSNSIKNLEEELGYTILIRQPNGVIFTEKGEKAIEVMKDIQKISCVFVRFRLIWKILLWQENIQLLVQYI